MHCMQVRNMARGEYGHLKFECFQYAYLSSCRIASFSRFVGLCTSFHGTSLQ
jgi:hypothetical protein